MAAKPGSRTTFEMRPDTSLERRFIVIALTALLSVVGCATPSADPRLVGTYVGEGSESLTILPNTRVYHTRLSGGQEHKVLIGYAATTSGGRPGSLSIIAPDTSPFIGTALQVSDDFQMITVSWQNFRDPKDTRQTQFVRKGDG